MPTTKICEALVSRIVAATTYIHQPPEFVSRDWRISEFTPAAQALISGIEVLILLRNFSSLSRTRMLLLHTWYEGDRGLSGRSVNSKATEKTIWQIERRCPHSNQPTETLSKHLLPANRQFFWLGVSERKQSRLSILLLQRWSDAVHGGQDHEYFGSCASIHPSMYPGRKL